MIKGRRVALGALAAAGVGAVVARSAHFRADAGAARGVNIVGNSFPAMQHMARAAEAQGRQSQHVSFKLTSEFQSDVDLAFASASQSVFDAAAVPQNSFSDLYGRSQLAPMTDLVRRYGSQFALEERMLVRVDGEVMAIAYLQNTQNLYYRGDLFDQYGIDTPATYADLVQAARRIRLREPNIPFPIAQGYGKGFDVATDFVNVFCSVGGRFFEPGSAEPVFNDEHGVEAIELMRSLLPFMTPNALASNSDDVMNQLQQGQSAMGVLWASRAARMDDPVASRVVGKVRFAAAPSAHAGGPSAAHLWWDGVVMPRNGAADRDRAFLIILEMLSEETVRTGNDLAIWVRSCYRPGRFGTGVELARRAGAPEWPGEPFFDLLQSELGRVLPDALAGQRTPKEVLDAAAQAFKATAVEKGYFAGVRS